VTVTKTPSRRTFLQAAAVSGASAALTLAPLRFADAKTSPGSGTTTATIAGHLDPGAADWVYLPVEVPDGVAQIAVSYSYSKPAVPPGTLSNSCDVGVFDQRGTRLNGDGFRGWSGGFRTEFTIAADSATPGYLPGPVRRGTWNVVLGPYQVSPLGLDYHVTVTLTFGPDRSPAFIPAYPPQAVRGTGPGWYRGDNHLHTVYSDGRRTPEQVTAGARAAGLQFMSTVRGSRRTRVEGGRPNKVTVRFTDDEFAVVSASAAAARLSVPAWLAVVGLTGTEDRVLDPASIRGMVIELFAVRRGMSNAGRNIKDVARLLLGTGELKRNTEVSVAEFRAATARVDAFLTELAGYLPGLDLKHVDW